MLGLISSLLKVTWRLKSTILVLLAVTLCIGFFAKVSYQQFIYLQAQNISDLSVFNEIIYPLAGLTLICQITLSLLISVQLIPTFVASGQGTLIQQSSVETSTLLFSLLTPILAYSLWPLLNLILISFVLDSLTNIDLFRLGVMLLGLIFIGFICSGVILAICLKARGVLLAALQSSFALVVLLVIEISIKELMPNIIFNLQWRGLFLPFFSMREGLIVYADLLNYLGWGILVFSICYLLVRRNTANNLSRKASIVTLLSLIIILASSFIPGKIDLSRELRSSLSKNLEQHLLSLTSTLEVIAVIDEKTNRDEIMRGFEIIHQVQPNSKIEFKSRQSLGPGIKHAGQYIQFKLDEQQQAVAYPFEQNVKIVFELAIEQMLKRKLQWITFVEGHGEASIFSKKPSGLGELYQELTAMGWPVAAQNLSEMPIISDNTGLLVIAASQQEWLPAEVDLVLKYLNRGGHLLVLADPTSFIPESIESFIGISRFNGTLVDWNGYQSGTPHPAVVIIHSKTKHPVVNNLNSLLAFPWASGLKLAPKENDPKLFFEPIINTHKGVWNELDINSEQLSFEQDKGELQQSFVLAMSHYNTETDQKIVFVGDSQFASDTAINNYANKQFTLNLISWLTNSARNNMESVNLDNSIKPDLYGHFIMNWFFSAILPLIILCLWLVSYGLRYRRLKVAFQ